ncbi:MAG TPA: hypothetical protein VGH28_31555 [Polyangiaceae bacterium]
MAQRGRFYHARLAVLTSILLVVVLYAWHDVHARHARKAWDHTLSIAVVVLRDGPVAPSAIDALRERAPALEDRLAAELHRYRPSAPKPFSFTFYGPIDGVPPPPAPRGDGIIDLARHTWDLHRWASDVDARGAFSVDAADSRIYVTAQPPRSKKHMIEGASEQGGRIGTVTVDLDERTVDFALSVIAHELFHTLDATDHYDESGRATIPDGLAEPDLVPRYPQRFVEIMARGRPISPSEEVVLDTLDDLAVGPTTAREIGWSQKE